MVNPGSAGKPGDDTFPPHRLGRREIEQLTYLVTGRQVPGTVAEAVHRRTAGDPRRVVVEILAALDDDRPLVEALSMPGDGRTDPAVGTFRREGDFWRLTYQGWTVLMRDARGLHYLSPLLRSPGQPTHVRDLVRHGGPDLTPADVERARQAVTKSIKLVLDRLRGCHPALAAHLEGTVRRGYVCRYEPAPQARIAWDL